MQKYYPYVNRVFIDWVTKLARSLEQTKVGDFNFNNKVLVSKNLYTSKCAAAFLHAVSD